MIVAVKSAVLLPGLASVNVAPDRVRMPHLRRRTTAVVLPVNAASATVAVPVIVVVWPPTSFTEIVMG